MEGFVDAVEILVKLRSAAPHGQVVVPSQRHHLGSITAVLVLSAPVATYRWLKGAVSPDVVIT